ncbi:hypothetical protein HYH03_005903 [Edaphochlamys debaryana]|uniref:Glycerophosphodiester phosphodiesterase n=1 Tax=Edaphochlamys debaryana TaxID=47281 RepID=A0A835Y6C7_9CHLO|nr:hypothetical protein HYH03_005903 [Edaphochlamys debaryana]|eukprot:KAG2495974.1 hypothetical protein HYH03_005903 [Edaphochlamys debaryana]
MCGAAHKGKTIAQCTYAELPRLLPRAPVEASAATADNSQSATGRTQSASASGNIHVATLSAPGAQTSAGPGPGSSAAAAGSPDPDATRIPLLEELLVEFPATPLQIDLKAATPGLVDAVYALLVRHGRARGPGAGTSTSGGGAGMNGGGGAGSNVTATASSSAAPTSSTSPLPAGNGSAAGSAGAGAAGGPGALRAGAGGVLWGSFLHPVALQLYGTDPGIPLFTSAPRAFLLLMAHRTGRMGEVHVYESAIILPMWVRSARAAALSALGRPRPPDNTLVRPDLFAALKAKGLSIVVFGSQVNDEAAFATCLAAGADALCTDSPSRLIRWLQATGRRPLGPGVGEGEGAQQGAAGPAAGRSQPAEEEEEAGGEAGGKELGRETGKEEGREQAGGSKGPGKASEGG